MSTGSPRIIQIVGGGFSGLSLAYFLVKQGLRVQIFEKRQWGGMISTKAAPEMQVEAAANGFLNSALLQEMSRDIRCELLPTLKQARKRFIFRGGQLRQWPVSFRSTLGLAKFVLKFIFFKRSVAPQEMETVASWSLRVLNSEILNYLVIPALQGIYAGDVQKLSAHLIFGGQFKPKKTQARVKRGTVAPALGMGDFMTCLKKYLESQGAQFQQNEVKDLKSLAKPVVLAIPPWDSAKIFDSDWSRCQSLGLIKVSLGFQKPQATISGFGVLFPAIEKFSSLGVLSNTNIFAGRGELYNESWILGGALYPELIKKTDAEILSLIAQDRKRALGSQDLVMSYDVVRWPQALPHYTIELESFLKNYKYPTNEIFLTGNYLGQLGLSKILEYNFELALKLKEKYG